MFVVRGSGAGWGGHSRLQGRDSRLWGGGSRCRATDKEGPAKPRVRVFTALEAEDSPGPWVLYVEGGDKVSPCPPLPIGAPHWGCLLAPSANTHKVGSYAASSIAPEAHAPKSNGV